MDSKQNERFLSSKSTNKENKQNRLTEIGSHRKFDAFVFEEGPLKITGITDSLCIAFKGVAPS